MHVLGQAKKRDHESKLVARAIIAFRTAGDRIISVTSVSDRQVTYTGRA